MPIPWSSGVRVGSWNLNADGRATKTAELVDYETWRGVPAAWVLEGPAAASNATWTQISGANWVTNIGALPLSVRQRFLVYLTVLPSAANDPAASMATIARGDHDAHFIAFADRMVTLGMAANPLRFMHEMNGTWYRWGVTGQAGSTAADYIAAWRHLVLLFRGRGLTGPMVWCPNNGDGGNGFNATLAYPGDAYVDIIAVNTYDQAFMDGSYPYVTGESAEQRRARQEIAWYDIKNGTRGLDFWLGFARSRGKKFGITEWGAFHRPDGHGGGDNPYYIQQMHAWLAASRADLAFELYFDEDASDGAHSLYPVSGFPLASAEYARLWAADLTVAGLNSSGTLGDASALYAGAWPPLAIYLGDSVVWKPQA